MNEQHAWPSVGKCNFYFPFTEYIHSAQFFTELVAGHGPVC